MQDRNIYSFVCLVCDTVKLDNFCDFTLLTALKNSLTENYATVSSFPHATRSKWHPPGKLKPNPLPGALLEVVVQFIK